jgi:hypothetical protein
VALRCYFAVHCRRGWCLVLEKAYTCSTQRPMQCIGRFVFQKQTRSMEQLDARLLYPSDEAKYWLISRLP